MIAVAGIGALLGMREAMKKHDIPGTVVLVGTPAEEGGAGKIKLLEMGGCGSPLSPPPSSLLPPSSSFLPVPSSFLPPPSSLLPPLPEISSETDRDRFQKGIDRNLRPGAS